MNWPGSPNTSPAEGTLVSVQTVVSCVRLSAYMPVMALDRVSWIFATERYICTVGAGALAGQLAILPLMGMPLPLSVSS